MNFEKCYDILSSRKEIVHVHSDDTTDEHPCNHPVQALESKVGTGSTSISSLSTEWAHASVHELFHEVHRLQECRVLRLKTFTSSFPQVHADTVAFQAFCTTMKSEFQHINDGMRAIEHQCDERKLKNLATTIRRLQKHEEDHLTLISAVLVEKMRQQHECGGGQHEEEEDLDQDVPEAKKTKIYAKTIAALELQQQACVRHINETLEDIRYDMMDIPQEALHF